MQRESRRRGAVVGLLTAGAALGAAGLVAGFIGEASAPIIVVGSALVDATPEWLKSFAIRAFGANDKMVLLAGIYLVLGLLAAGIGVLTMRRRWVGFVALAAFGLAGAFAAASRPAAGQADVLPAIAGAVAGAIALSLLTRFAVAGTESRRLLPSDASPETIPDPARRRFMLTGLAVGGTSLAAGAAGRVLLQKRFDVEASREKVVLPSAANTPGATTGDALKAPGLTPFLTPNDEFYRVDTSLIVPKVMAEEWRLRIHGMVDRELTLNLEALMPRPAIEREITLACVSNPVGGKYIGNAIWLGTSFADLLREAGVHSDATQLVSTSVDGFTLGTPVEAIMDGRDALLAYGMNGEPLPLEHGFPVRQIVPGLYGYVSATKWVVDMELTTFEAFDPYWVRRGWAEQAPIKTQSRIDTPRSKSNLAAGEVPVAGIAWAQHRGIERVEVLVDGAVAGAAQLGSSGTIDTWKQWVYRWNATPGQHTLQVRAIDGEGETQPETMQEPFPDGATGWHTIEVGVE
ncbi:MAG: molybdopterin-dependent oxidoreductase [Actinomycetota bacterium]